MNRKLIYVAITSCVVAVVALSSVWIARSNAKSTPETLIIKPTDGRCSLCYTCGSKWPVYGGQFDIPSGNVQERGSSCSGDFPASASDTAPYLCCKK